MPRMPSDDPPRASDSSSNGERQERTSETIRRYRLRILVADDDDIFRASIALRLRILYQATVVTVTGGREVFQATQDDDAFNLILIDVRMRDLDGITIAEALRKGGVVTPIVLMSAYYSAGTRLAANALRLPLISKTIATAELEQVLLTCCGGLAL